MMISRRSRVDPGRLPSLAIRSRTLNRVFTSGGEHGADAARLALKQQLRKHQSV